MLNKFENLFSVESKVIIITGSNRGNGLALAKGLKDLGAKVARIDLKFENDIGTYDIVCDLTEFSNLKKAVKDIVEEYKDIDGLINNAGISLETENPYLEIKNYQQTIDVNLNSAFILSSCVANFMAKKKKGSIVNITSLGAERAFPSNPGYQVSKAGLRQLSKSMARDWGCYNLRFNNICPGYIRTKMTEKSYNNQKKYKERLNQMIIKRWGEPYDLVGPAAFLISDASSYITGSDIYVDGGWTANGGL
tara:strand:- start:203 stop:952 length:750 start_codon:yes stop_codon:yes gene_type:complete